MTLAEAFELMGQHIYPDWTGEESAKSPKSPEARARRRFVREAMRRSLSDCQYAVYLKNGREWELVRPQNGYEIRGPVDYEASRILLGDYNELAPECKIERKSFERFLNQTWPKRKKETRGRMPIDREQVKAFVDDVRREHPRVEAQKQLRYLVKEKYKEHGLEAPGDNIINEVLRMKP